MISMRYFLPRVELFPSLQEGTRLPLPREVSQTHILISFSNATIATPTQDHCY